MALEVRCAALGTPGSGERPPENLGASTRGAELTVGVFLAGGALGDCPVDGQYCSPRPCTVRTRRHVPAPVSIRWGSKGKSTWAARAHDPSSQANSHQVRGPVFTCYSPFPQANKVPKWLKNTACKRKKSSSFNPAQKFHEVS